MAADCWRDRPSQPPAHHERLLPSRKRGTIPHVHRPGSDVASNTSNFHHSAWSAVISPHLFNNSGNCLTWKLLTCDTGQHDKDAYSVSGSLVLMYSSSFILSWYSFIHSFIHSDNSEVCLIMNMCVSLADALQTLNNVDIFSIAYLTLSNHTMYLDSSYSCWVVRWFFLLN